MRSRPSWEESEAGAIGSWRLPAILVGLLAFVLGRLSVGASPACAPALGSAPPLKDVADEVKRALYSPPDGHGEVAVPSVLRDARGEIHNLRIGGVRFNVLVSRAGTMRSGDVHAQTQYDLILKVCSVAHDRRPRLPRALPTPAATSHLARPSPAARRGACG